MVNPYALGFAIGTSWGIRSGSVAVALFRFNFLTIVLISSLETSGNLKEIFFYAQLFDFDYTWIVFILLSKAVHLSKFGFFGLPIQFGASFLYNICLAIIK